MQYGLSASFRVIMLPVYLIRAYFPEDITKCSYRVNPWVNPIFLDNTILSPMHVSLQAAPDMSHPNLWSHQTRKYSSLLNTLK